MNEKNDLKTLKLKILAETDALFWPRRSMVNRAAIEQARDFYHEAGLILRGGGEVNTRQRLHRQLDALEAAGEILVSKQPGANAVCVKLTPEAESELRKACCMTTYDSVFPVLKDILQAGRKKANVYGAWIRETALTGTPYGEPDATGRCSRLAEWFLPLLLRGLVKSNADSQRHVWYMLTDEGEKLAKTIGKQKGDSIDLDTWTDREEYLQMFYAAEKALDALKPRDERDIGPIPIPCSI